MIYAITSNWPTYKKSIESNFTSLLEHVTYIMPSFDL